MKTKQPIYTAKDGRNIIEIFTDHAEIILEDINGNEIDRAMIDVEDVDQCKEYRWYVYTNSKDKYVKSSDNTIYLHRYILNVNSTNARVQFLDGDSFNCRKSNLKIKNLSNKPKQKAEPIIISSINRIIQYKDHAEMILHDKDGQEAHVMIDIDDIDKCKDIVWHYYPSSSGIQSSNKDIGYLHRYIMNVFPKDKDKKVVFSNNNILDCRKSNLVCLTQSELYYYNEEKKQSQSNNNTTSDITPTSTPDKNYNIIRTDKGYSVFFEYDGQTYDLGRHDSEGKAKQAIIDKVYEIYRELDPLGLFNL